MVRASSAAGVWPDCLVCSRTVFLASRTVTDVSRSLSAALQHFTMLPMAPSTRVKTMLSSSSLSPVSGSIAQAHACTAALISVTNSSVVFLSSRHASGRL
eukprot:408817-Pyramimonas_sp.AAC.1